MPLPCARRLLQMFGDVVLGLPHHDFEACLSSVKTTRGLKYDIELTAEDLQEVVSQYKQVYSRHGEELPSDSWKQLEMGVDAVFR